MSGGIFNNSSKLQAAVALTNLIAGEKFPRIASRIADKLHDRNKAAFNFSEKKKLTEILEISSEDVQLVLDTIEFIFQQSAYHGLKPSALKHNLLELKLSEEKTNCICVVWQNHGKTIVDNLKNQAIVPNQLREVSWDLNLKLAQKSKSNLKEPNANFQLGIANQDSGESQNLILNFNHEELLKFYGKLEIIQSQMDSLS